MENVLCKLGFHDWKVMGSTTIYQLKENIKAKAEKRTPDQIDYGERGRVVTKVCLRCEKVDDQIHRATKKAKLQLIEESHRRHRAKLILEKHNRGKKQMTND